VETPDTLEGVLALARGLARTLDLEVPLTPPPGRVEVDLAVLSELLRLVLATHTMRPAEALKLDEDGHPTGAELERIDRSSDAAGRAYYLGITQEVPLLPTWEELREETQLRYRLRALEVVAAWEEARRPQ
jgi:hypothetical protein